MSCEPCEELEKRIQDTREAELRLAVSAMVLQEDLRLRQVGVTCSMERDGEKGSGGKGKWSRRGMCQGEPTRDSFRRFALTKFQQ